MSFVTSPSSRVTRRAVLHTAAGAAAVAMLPAPQKVVAADDKRPWIDAHTSGSTPN